ncbi:uncharacterized protein LOC125945390 [Dermacentor silvarum]|uniref:uncharacterized protein LOC125945390 n=1 Tax=Dermacentor silvarum TaxID=543639 RepID=UPI002100AC53|nr:uncharacterized protein LOC125945390 [Dermacentor silvarum]
MAGVFGDALAMALVAIGSVLIALLIWLLMRKYNREYPRNVEPSKVATPATISRETTAASIWGPCKKPNENPSISGVGITQPVSEGLNRKPKESLAVFPGKKPPSAEYLTDKSTGKTTDKKKDKPADKREDKPVADKQGVDARAQGHASKKREGSTGSAASLEQNKEQRTKDEQREKSKKSEQLSASIVDSGFSKHKSKQPKRSKPAGAQPDTAVATTDAGAVSPKAPPEGVTQEPAIDTTTPALPDNTLPSFAQQKPSQVEAPVPQVSQLGAKSPAVAIVDRGPASDTHDLDDSTLQKLRKEVLMRRASHASMHSTRLRPAVESPKVPTELDIFSEEHSTASIARATTVRERQSHSGHKQKHKPKSSSSRPASTVPVDVAFAGSKSECTSPPPGLVSPPRTSAGVVPASDARDGHLSALEEVGRAGYVSQHSVLSAPRVPKAPSKLDNFSEEPTCASVVETTSQLQKSKEGGKHKHKRKHKYKPAASSPPVAATGTTATATLPTGNLDESTVQELRRDISKRRASHVSVRSLRQVADAAKVPAEHDIFSEQRSSESNVPSGCVRVEMMPISIIPDTADAGPAPENGDLDEHTVQQLRQDLMKRRASHASMHSVRSIRAPAKESASPKVPTELDIFSEQHASEINVAAGCARVKLLPPSTMPDTADAGPAQETGDLDEHTVQQLRQDLMKRRASHASMHSVRSIRAPPKESASPKVPPELDIFSEQHSSIGPNDDPQMKKKKGKNIFSEQPSPE